MEKNKRLIDANNLLATMKEMYCDGCKNNNGVRCVACDFDSCMQDIENAPTVDAVELPKGKPGDYLEWDNGTGFKKIYCICAVMICEDCVRYDLEKFAPEVNHKNIVRIMSKEQAVKEYRDRCARERTEEEPTMTAERLKT